MCLPIYVNQRCRSIDHRQTTHCWLSTSPALTFRTNIDENTLYPLLKNVRQWACWIVQGYPFLLTQSVEVQKRREHDAIEPLCFISKRALKCRQFREVALKHSPARPRPRFWASPRAWIKWVYIAPSTRDSYRTHNDELRIHRKRVCLFCRTGWRERSQLISVATLTTNKAEGHVNIKMSCFSLVFWGFPKKTYFALSEWLNWTAYK